jgi:hypothetical protein
MPKRERQGVSPQVRHVPRGRPPGGKMQRLQRQGPRAQLRHLPRSRPRRAQVQEDAEAPAAGPKRAGSASFAAPAAGGKMQRLQRQGPRAQLRHLPRSRPRRAQVQEDAEASAAGPKRAGSASSAARGAGGLRSTEDAEAPAAGPKRAGSAPSAGPAPPAGSGSGKMPNLQRHGPSAQLRHLPRDPPPRAQTHGRCRGVSGMAQAHGFGSSRWAGRRGRCRGSSRRAQAHSFGTFCAGGYRGLRSRKMQRLQRQGPHAQVRHLPRGRPPSGKMQRLQRQRPSAQLRHLPRDISRRSTRPRSSRQQRVPRPAHRSEHLRRPGAGRCRRAPPDSPPAPPTAPSAAAR